MTTKKLENTNELPDEIFEQPDDEVPELETTQDYKFTKIDCLDEDPAPHGEKYVLMSFISPEGLMNCKINGLKIRGDKFYSSLKEAEDACNKLKEIDKYFDIFVAPVGKWLPWNPTTKQVEKMAYRNKKQDKIMKKVHEAELSTLNEIAGRHKEAQDKSKKSHEKRVRETIKDSINNYEDNTTETPLKEHKEKTPVRNTHDGALVRQRLKKIIDDRKKNEVLKSTQKCVKQFNTDITQEIINDKEKIKIESDRINENEKNLNELKQEASKIDIELEKMKELYKLRKKQRENTNS